jgi:tRNA A-37 threonylcarbamoyl transferase component Bud32
MSEPTPNYLFVKDKVSLREYKIYKHLHNMDLSFIPKLYRYDKFSQQLTTQRINGISVSDYYGEDFLSVPKKIISQIRNIIRYLYNIGIVYPDITGYNFIIDNKSKIWLIDFEHCFYVNNLENIDNLIFDDDIPDKEEQINFVINFAFNNEKSWNKYYM